MKRHLIVKNKCWCMLINITFETCLPNLLLYIKFSFMKRILTLLFVLCLVSFAFGQSTLPLVRFSHGAEIFPDNFKEVLTNPSVAASEVVNGHYVRYIQCERLLSSSERNELQTLGIEIQGYVHFGAYLSSIPIGFDLNKIKSLPIRSMIPVNPDWKMAQSLREQPYGDWAVHGEDIDVNIQLYDHVSIPEGAEKCRQMGLVVLKEGTQNGFLRVRIAKDNITAIAALPFVHFMELMAAPGQKEDILGRSLHRANVLDGDHASSKKYDGTGMKMLVRDDGKLGPHIDLQGRLYNLALGSETDGTHGDGVGGIMGGAGNLDPTKKGMAAGADVYALDYESEYQDQTLDLHLIDGVTITNSSYSNGCNAGYTTATQTVDEQIFENPTLMHVFSAGNSNSVDCGYGAGNQWGNITGGHKMAKNAIATANLFSDATLVASSSRGPAHDGRMKPDIAANGQDQESLSPNNTYQVFGGTSGAAPGIAGCLTQLSHAYASLNGGTLPSSALLKATILNTANDLGNIGPDYKYGWGHINTVRALQLIEQNKFTTGSVDQGATGTHTISIPNNTKLVKVMVYWAEPPSEENASRALLNDLDLTLTGSNGTVYKPWLLNPTPDPVSLDAPAVRGRDSLNNMEQVAIENPSAGTYTVNVKGFEVPLGPQNYVIVWETYNDNIKVTYPNGGEGLVPGETARIHWDAYGSTANITLRYSTNDGNTWEPITTITDQSARWFNWTVPNVRTGQAKVLVIRGTRRDTSDFAFSITPVPTGVGITKVCPDSLTVAWTQVHDTLSYDVYLLGSKYMDLKGRSDTTFLAIPILNAGAKQWVSVRTADDFGMTGRRALAVQWDGGLLNCPQEYDLGISELISPAANGGAIVGCGAATQKVIIKVKNEGQNTIGSATANYKVNNNATVSEVLPALIPGQVIDYEFVTPLVISQNGNLNLTVWVNYGDDSVVYNDTTGGAYSVVIDVVNGVFTEDFEAASAQNLPDGWVGINPDGDIGWSVFTNNVIGSGGDNTTVMGMNFFDYSQREVEDYLYMIPVDLSNVDNPGLTFDLAHIGYNDTYFDSLRVEVFANCNLSATPVTVWGKKDPELSTAPFSVNSFTPTFADQWRKELVDLSAFAGQSVVIRFVSWNDFGNNLYLDNIGITEYSITPPVAEIVSSNETICRNDTNTYTAINYADGAAYSWSFGSFAQPTSASGPGPHVVKYITAGTKSIRLVANNSFGSDTSNFSLTVLALPSSNFTSTANALTVTFTNTSTNAANYLWNFGDGQTSIEANPVHTYAAPGTYSVKLESTNQCTTAVKTVNVVLTSGVKDLADRIDMQVVPNPTVGDFKVEINARQPMSNTRFSLNDATGRLIKTIDTNIKSGLNVVPFEGLSLPRGVYQLQVQHEDGVQMLSIVVAGQ